MSCTTIGGAPERLGAAELQRHEPLLPVGENGDHAEHRGRW